MSHSYPIWNIVTEDAYRSGKSYGARDWTRTEVRVGTSARNSEVLCSHYVKRDPCLGGEWMRFEFGVELPDGTDAVIVRKWMHVKSKTWQDVDPRESPALLKQGVSVLATATSSAGCVPPRDELRDQLTEYGFLAVDEYGGAFDGFTVTSDADPGL